MQRQIQKSGVRKWFGEDFIKLQNQLYEAIEAIGNGLNDNFVISGCEVAGNDPYDISSGIVFIDGNICTFAGASGVSWPFYLNKQTDETDNQPYNDGVTRATEIHYKAVSGSDSQPNIEFPSPMSFDRAIIQLTDSVNINSSTVAASATAVNTLKNLLDQQSANYPLEAPNFGDNTAVKYGYRKVTKDLVQIRISFKSTTTGASVLFSLPTGYKPSGAILATINNDAVVKVQTDGTVILQENTVPGNVDDYYFIEVPLWDNS